jgi:uncharacterized RDD family membrane protein YckC
MERMEPSIEPPRILPTQRAAPGLHAGFWLRVAAWLIDALILAPIVAFAVALVVGVAVRPPGLAATGGVVAYELATGLWVWPIAFGLAWLYYGLSESSRWQATPGKLVLGLKVTDDRGRRIGFARASVRWLGMLLSGAIADMGYLIAAWTPRKQALHDLLARCCVVRAEELQAWCRAEAADEQSVPSVGSTVTRGMPGWAVALLVFGIGAFVVLPLAVVLSGIAVPAYRAHRVRGEVAHALEATARVRALVGEYIVQRGALPADNRVLGLSPTDAVRARYVRNAFVAHGKVVVTFGGEADGRVRGGHLVISPVGDAARLRWYCTSPDIPRRYLPRQCRD